MITTNRTTESVEYTTSEAQNNKQPAQLEELKPDPSLARRIGKLRNVSDK